jgi:uncharacterized damage-inducible protein DinB
MSGRMYPLEKIDHPLFLLWRYNLWANSIFLNASESLSPDQFLRDIGDGCGSFRDKLAHIFAADEIWMMRIKSVPDFPFTKPEEIPSLTELKKKWNPILDNYSQLLEDPSTDYKQLVVYKNLRGKEFQTTLYEILLHVYNHSTYHRGQAASLFRRLTGKPPVTDLMEYFKFSSES